MSNMLAAAVGYGGYVSLIKFVIMVATFFAWMPLVNWVHTDSQAVRTKVKFWTIIVGATGAIALILWILIPFFMIGLMLYIVAVGATSMAYVIHRNARVADFEKVMTASHIKNIFVDENKKLSTASKGFEFITANNNEVPMPKPKSPEAQGFKITCEIFEDALWRRASDVLFRPGQNDYSVIYQIDGMAAKQDPRTKEDAEFFLNFAKQLADLDTEERRKPQVGTFKVIKDSVRTEWEITTAGSTAGEQARIRRMEEYSMRKIEDLGLNADQIEPLQNLKKLNSGLIIVSGPKKSGVTTTLYAFLRNHDPFMNNINTLERKPSGELTNITQHTYTMTDTGTTTYAKKLQSILRMGPDIIGIADCQDSESAKLACAAAKDGKIVYVTIEATSVVQALGKWLKMVPDKNLVADVLKEIVNQRLVRILCDKCKQAYQPNQDLFRKFNIPSDKIKLLYRPGEIEYGKHGKPILCEGCQGTGFYTRTGIFETIVINDKLKETIKQAKSLQEIAAKFRQSGMLYMQEQSIKKVASGITSINEVIREFSTNQNPEKQQTKPT